MYAFVSKVQIGEFKVQKAKTLTLTSPPFPPFPPYSIRAKSNGGRERDEERKGEGGRGEKEDEVKEVKEAIQSGKGRGGGDDPPFHVSSCRVHEL